MTQGLWLTHGSLQLSCRRNQKCETSKSFCIPPWTTSCQDKWFYNSTLKGKYKKPSHKEPKQGMFHLDAVDTDSPCGRLIGTRPSHCCLELWTFFGSSWEVGERAMAENLCFSQLSHLGVSKNTGTPKWMVKIMENPIKMDDLGVFPYFWKHPFGFSVYGFWWDQPISDLWNPGAGTQQCRDLCKRKMLAFREFPLYHSNSEGVHPLLGP